MMYHTTVKNINDIINIIIVGNFQEVPQSSKSALTAEIV